jgi:small subunit ribosomal protein S1
MANTSSAIYDEFKKYVEELQQPPKTFKKGDLVRGEVISFKKGEMLVDIGGRTEGVVLGKELKLEDEDLEKNPGDKVLVYVLKSENILGQIELSIRRTGVARKWDQLFDAQENDKSITVSVIEANTGGVIVSIGGGLRGFIPTSQLDNARIYPLSGYGDKDNAAKELQNKLGELIEQNIEVKVIEIDQEKNRVILSEKLVTMEDDSELREETLGASGIGHVLDGEITGIAPFGLFVKAQGLEGLVHLSEISWDKVSNPADFFKIGDSVKVQIIGIQDNGKRVAYSIKRLQSDPWDDIVKNYSIGQKVSGIVTKVVNYGAFIRIDDSVNGLIHISEMSDKLVKDPADYVKIGDSVDVVIISISKEERHLGLSMKQINKTISKKATKEEASTTKAVAPEMESLDKLLEE